MNKTFLASSAVMITAAALGWWIVADPFSGPSHQKRTAQLSVATETQATPPEAPSLIGPPRPVDEFIVLSNVFAPTGQELDLQNLLDCVNPEFLPAPRAIADWLADAGEEASSPPDRLTMLIRTAYRLVAWKCAELMAQAEPLIGAFSPLGNSAQLKSAFGELPYPLTNETMEARPSDLAK